MGGVRVLLAAALLVFAAGGCRGGGDDDDIASPTPLDVTFSAGVMPVLAASCLGSTCHDDVNPAAELALGGPSMTSGDVYVEIQTGGLAELTGGPAVLDTANDAQSTLLTEPLEGSGVTHGGGKQFATTSVDGYRTILGWIEAGAPND